MDGISETYQVVLMMLAGFAFVGYLVIKGVGSFLSKIVKKFWK